MTVRFATSMGWILSGVVAASWALLLLRACNLIQ